jgi:ornithine cyclodeaminase
MPERAVLPAPGHGSLLVMPCADEEGWFGVKQVAVLPENQGRGLPTVQAWYTLFDPAGRPALACAATLLTKVRTAAVSALAARYLAPREAKSLLVVGTGSLAPWLAEAHTQVRSYAEVAVWGRNYDKARGTAADIRQRLGGEVLVRAEEVLAPAARAADVITLATTAKEAVLRGEALRAGQHLDLVGAFLPEMREVDAEAVTRAAVYVDDLDACKAEAGDLIRAEAEGWSFAHVRGDLAALVAGEARRESDEALTLFKSVGLALEDLVVAKLLV